MRCAAASPVMPPPITATRGIRGRPEGGRAMDIKSFGNPLVLRHLPNSPFLLPPFSSDSTLPDMIARVPGPVRLRMGAEAPFEAECKREVVLRGNSRIPQRDLVRELCSRGQPAADWKFHADAHRKCPQLFVATMAMCSRVVDGRDAHAATPVRTKYGTTPRVVQHARGEFGHGIAALGVAVLFVFE